MENKKYLNEENYQKSVKKLKKIALIILIVGLLIGGTLVTIGIVNIVSGNDKANEIIDEQLGNNDTNEETNTRTAAEIQSEIDALNIEISNLKAAKQTEFSKNGFSQEYYRLDGEITTKENQQNSLSLELFAIQGKDFVENTNGDSLEKTTKTIFNIASGLPFIIFGGFVIFFTAIIAFGIYLFAKKRDIMAFTAQQSIPVAKEIVEDVTPTIGNAAGSIGKEIAKGITEGIKEGNNNENQNN